MKQGMKKKFSLLVILSIMVLCFAGMTTYASSWVYDLSVKVTGRSLEGELEYPEIEVLTDGCVIDDVTWGKNIEDWKPGRKTILTLRLATTDGRKFQNSYDKKTCKVNGVDFEYAKAKDSNEALEVRLSYYPLIKLGTTESADWSEAVKGRGTWKRVDYATAYQVQLFEGDKAAKTFTVTENHADFLPYVKEGEDYYFKVRAIEKDSSLRKYVKDGEYISSDTGALTDIGDTSGTWRTTKEGKQYKESDGKLVTNSWKHIRDQWYYFNDKGYAMTGWLYLNSRWYYTDVEGVMQTGWLKNNEKWYYLHGDGAMATGWAQVKPEQWYYMYDDGSMAANTTIDGNYVDSSGLRR